MGRAVAAVLDGREDAVLALAFDKDDAPDLSACDVIVDFTTGAASAALARACAAAKGPALVIGSTGLTAEEEAAIAEAARAIPIVKSGNFSLGVNVLAGLVRRAARALGPDGFDLEILEAHHKRKVDAPSGTALMLGRAAAEGRGVSLDQARTVHREGVTGPRETGAIGFSVVRGGGIVGEHAVILAGEDEVLTLSHSARDRGLFARGAVAAALWTRGRPAGLYDMQDVLDLKD